MHVIRKMNALCDRTLNLQLLDHLRLNCEAPILLLSNTLHHRVHGCNGPCVISDEVAWPNSMKGRPRLKEPMEAFHRRNSKFTDLTEYKSKPIDISKITNNRSIHWAVHIAGMYMMR